MPRLQHSLSARQRKAPVITDLEMPVIGGRVLAKAVHKLAPELPILMMSGASKVSDEELSDFPNAFLKKPFTASNLLQVVHRLLSPKGSAQPFEQKT